MKFADHANCVKVDGVDITEHVTSIEIGMKGNTMTTSTDQSPVTNRLSQEDLLTLHEHLHAIYRLLGGGALKPSRLHELTPGGFLRADFVERNANGEVETYTNTYNYIAR